MIQKTEDNKMKEYESFRLLNSEIGNDPIKWLRGVWNTSFGFRLLNSEIGNDPSNIKMASEWGLRP